MLAANTRTSSPRNAYLGLFLVSASTLSLELLLTRIFSVTLWYHFAFMVVSIALFGMTAGALLVFLRPQLFEGEKVMSGLALSAVLFALVTVVAFLLHLQFPLIEEGSAFLRPGPLVALYFLMSVPFFFSGMNVTTALTKVPAPIGRLYAADLAGAAAGCLFFVLTLNTTDGRSAIFLTALLASLGALAYSRDHLVKTPLRFATVLSSALFLVIAIALSASFISGIPWMTIRWVKGEEEATPLFERWNSYSRITVWGDPHEKVPAFGFGFSNSERTMPLVRQLRLEIDASADTYLTAFDGDLSGVAYLRDDIAYAAHQLRPESRVLVIGSGGGRDLLAALVYGQREIVGVEVNNEIVDLVHGTLGDFTGHLDTIPGVTIIADEARSFVARQREPFDIIQISLIDTWAASAAGAFVLTEHTLYTVEAWDILLDHISPQGILSVSRWYFPDQPYETYRLVALAAEALRQKGATEPEAHVVMLTNVGEEAAQGGQIGLATLLVSPEPYSEEDLHRIAGYVKEHSFNLLLSPGDGSASVLEKIMTTEDLALIASDWPETILPPTDDRPFFFFGVRIGDLLQGRIDLATLSPATNGAILILGTLTGIVLCLTFLAFLIPLVFVSGRSSLRHTWSLFAYFLAIGFGYLMVEVSQLQQLIIFLGHPTFAVTVVLFTLLLASGIGSLSTSATGRWKIFTNPASGLIVLLIALALYGVVTPGITEACSDCSTGLRVAVVVMLLFPVGFLMGMPFPLGMRRASSFPERLEPWLFGVNGATSVAGSVLAVTIAVSIGIKAAFITGLAAYCLAALVYRADIES